MKKDKNFISYLPKAMSKPLKKILSKK